MTRTPLALALTAAAALAGCNQEDHNIVAGGPADPMGNQANADVVLPPAIMASKIYRCKDNSVIYVDWLSDGSARVRKDRNEVGTSVQVGDAGPIKGTPEASAISYNGQSCKA